MINIAVARRSEAAERMKKMATITPADSQSSCRDAIARSL
jgi:hypothetical protein